MPREQHENPALDPTCNCPTEQRTNSGVSLDIVAVRVPIPSGKENLIPRRVWRRLESTWINLPFPIYVCIYAVVAAAERAITIGVDEYPSGRLAESLNRDDVLMISAKWDSFENLSSHIVN